MPPARRSTDPREFVRVSVDLPVHRKLAALDQPAPSGWLYVVGLCHAGQNLTDGHVPERVAIRTAGVTKRAADALVTAGLWHRPGHDCQGCPQPATGSVYVHDYLQHQRSRDDAEAARDKGKRAAAARWGTDAPSNAPGNASSNAPSNAEAEAEAEKPSLLTYISRLAGSDARAGEGLPAEVLIGWQEISGPHVDLESEARSYLAMYGDRPARDERKAWLGHLRRAREHAERQRPAAGPAVASAGAPTPIPGTPTCPIHPEHPTGSKACPACTREKTPAPNLRALIAEEAS